MGYQRMLNSEPRLVSAKVGIPSRTRKKKISATKRMAEYPEALIKRVITNSRQLRDFSIVLRMSLRARPGEAISALSGDCFRKAQIGIIVSQVQIQVQPRSAVPQGKGSN